MIGLDTTAIIDLFKGDERLRSKLLHITDPLVSTQLNYLELAFGIDPSNPRHQEEQEYYDDLFTEIDMFPLDSTSCKAASRIHWTLQNKGYTIGKFDCTVAGILLRHGVTNILTRNIKHFSHIQGLRVIGY